jgi:hypothetical protein
VGEDAADNLLASGAAHCSLSELWEKMQLASGAVHCSLSELTSEQISSCCSNETLTKRVNYHYHDV